ncbi:MAG: phenylalanine--tRNA ligase subunit beta [Putridiphycobacter sp.]
MKVSYNWLKNYVNTTLSPEEMSTILTDTGLEVEGLEKVETIKGGLEGVVIGEVLTKTKHPDADKLNVTTVNIGTGEPLQIVCGAPNVEAGQKVVVVTVGSTLYPTPDEPFKIKKSKIRGVESFGMICAEDELGLGTSHDGIMVLPQEAKIGTPAKSYFNIEDDYLIEIGLTPNRSDAMGHIGVARDLKAYLNYHQNANLKLEFPEVATVNLNGQFNIKVEDNEDCPRYVAAILKNIKIKPSPDWLQNKLRIIGLNPINNVVDITNFVMHETGNPLHAFDLRVVGNELKVRRAKAGEKLTSLDGVERELHPDDLMICNQNDPMCIAGVFGGETSGVQNDTTDILLEAAYFNPVVVRKTAKRHGLNTDSSFRFERGIDPNQVIFAMERAIKLLVDLADAELVEAQDNYPTAIKNTEINFSFNRCRQLIGTTISNADIKTILGELDIEVKSESNDEAVLAVPPYRTDVTRQADVVEEVLRIYGYNNVPNPEKLNTSISYQKKPNPDKLYNIVANLLADQGYFEIMNNSLTGSKYLTQVKTNSLNADESVTLLNPLSQELDVMRQTLLFGGLQSIAHNQNRQHPNLRLFEFGKTYLKNDKGYFETQKLGIWLTGAKSNDNWANDNQKVSFYNLKGITETILNKLGILKNNQNQALSFDLLEDGYQISIAKKNVGNIGWVKPEILKPFGVKNQVFYAELNWDTILELSVMNKIKFTELPKTQFVRRDFSLLLDDQITFAQIQEIARKADRKILKEVGLFDVYEGKNLEKGKKSYAVNFIFQDDQKTLQDKTVDKIMDKIRNGLETELKAVLR